MNTMPTPQTRRRGPQQGWLGSLSLFVYLAAWVFPTALSAAPVLGLDDLLRIGLSENPSVLAARDQVEAARGNAEIARAYPNPEITGQSGHGQERDTPTPLSGSVYSISLNQPIEYPMVRNARIDAAEANVRSVDAGRQAFEDEAAARIKLAYYDLLRRQAEESAAMEDLQLTQQIRDRVALRHGVGESPKFDLITAETELLNAQKTHDAAMLRVQQVRANLRMAVGRFLPEGVEIRGELPKVVELPSLAQLQQELADRNPDLQRGDAERIAAEHRLDLEKSQRLPKISLLAQHDVDPTLSSSRAGVALTIPLWDWRSGQVAQAQADLSRSRNMAASRRLMLSDSLEASYNQYKIASNQVSMLENQLLAQAAEAQRIAEAAYRYGERGILDWLNAQRTYRAARNELITARYELAAVSVEIDRLRSRPALSPTPALPTHPPQMPTLP
jgi:cobalt-zinc-cadmium efflux system outer membrane protein